MGFFLSALFTLNTSSSSLSEYEIDYKAQYNGLDIKATYTLKNKGDNKFVEYSSVKNILGEITEISEFKLINEDHRNYPELGPQNWSHCQISNALALLPKFDENNQEFVEPFLPNTKIGIMHLAAGIWKDQKDMRIDKSIKIELKTLNNSTVTKSLRYLD